MKVKTGSVGRVRTIEINRPEVRNAVDAETADMLFAAFLRFDEDENADVAVLSGVGATFCAGADLKALQTEIGERLRVEGPAPMGPTRMVLGKPVIAAVEGYAVAGGLELATWCDLRVAAEDAVFGVFCRRLGVPLVDGGTVRLPRLIGQSHALDLILTGRAVGADEARTMGLANRVVPSGEAKQAAVQLAQEIAAHPQTCLRNDRSSTLGQWGLDEDDAMARELQLGLATIGSGETATGARRFSDGLGRHGESL